MDLRCRKTNCIFNKDLTCTATSIGISSKLKCQKFKLDITKEEVDFSKMIFSDKQPKIANYRPLKDMCLSCSAKCLFNENGHCLANGITINAGTTKEPKCITFMKP